MRSLTVPYPVNAVLRSDLTNFDCLDRVSLLNEFNSADLHQFITNETTNIERKLYLNSFYASSDETISRSDLEKLLELFFVSESMDIMSIRNLLASHCVICCTNELMKQKWQMRPVPGSGLSIFFYYR